MPLQKGRLRQVAARFERASMGQIQDAFAPGLDLPEDFGAPRRKRLFTPAATCWLFLAQVLSADGSCQDTLLGFLAELFLAQGKTASPNTSAYCQARARLNTPELKAVARALAGKVEIKGEPWLWKDRRVRDGWISFTPASHTRYWPRPAAKGRPPASLSAIREGMDLDSKKWL